MPTKKQPAKTKNVIASAARQSLPLPEPEEVRIFPWQAYAIVGDKEDPKTWQLPQHTYQVNRAAQGKIGYEHTVAWQMVEQAVESLSLQGIEGKRVNAEPEQIIAAARHLASHYQKAGRPTPLSLAVLV